MQLSSWRMAKLRINQRLTTALPEVAINSPFCHVQDAWLQWNIRARNYALALGRADTAARQRRGNIDFHAVAPQIAQPRQ